MPKKKNEQQEFYENLQSVAKLIGDLALNIADAQDRMDTSYVENLGEFLKAMRSVKVESSALQGLITSMAPSRYQFTETVVEVRADLQMSNAKELGLDVTLGYKTPVMAATINASYVKRSAYDFRASALIRTVMHAVPADPKVMATLLEAAANAEGTELPENSRYDGLAGSLEDLPALEAPADIEGQETAAEPAVSEVVQPTAATSNTSDVAPDGPA